MDPHTITCCYFARNIHTHSLKKVVQVIMIKKQTNSKMGATARYGVGVHRAFFDVIVRYGSIYHSPHLSLKVYSASKQQPPESEKVTAGQSLLYGAFSFVISKKIAKHAVTRNLLKRRGRHILKNSIHNIKQPGSGIFFFKKGSNTLSFDALQEEMLSLLTQAAVLDSTK